MPMYIDVFRCQCFVKKAMWEGNQRSNRALDPPRLVTEVLHNGQRSPTNYSFLFSKGKLEEVCG